jgi:manganese/iron transport system substrate-binding protein
MITTVASLLFAKPSRLLLLIGVVFSLCGKPASLLFAQEKKPLIVCSTTQIADFARNIVGDRWEVQSILSPGADPHLYDIKDADARLVTKATLCLENGWHLEGKDWMRTLAKISNKPIITCVDGIEPLELNERGEKVRDPHAWFSPINAAKYVRNISAAVVKSDPTHAAEYEQRAELYLGQLRLLHTWIQSQMASVPVEQRVLVTSHDAFHYFCREYQFRSQTPAGWSTGDEIGGGVTEQRRRETIAAIRASGIKAIFVETSVNDAMIRNIAQEAGVVVGGKLYSDSMGEENSGGEDYIGMMRENVLTIVAALGKKD